MEYQKQQEVKDIRQQIREETKRQQDVFEQDLRHRLQEESKHMVQQLEETKRQMQQDATDIQQINDRLQQQIGNVSHYFVYPKSLNMLSYGRSQSGGMQKH